MDNYLQEISTRATAHNKTLEKTKAWLIKNEIQDYDQIQNCLVISQVWIANKLGRSITQGDLLMFLGSEADLTGKDMYKDITLTDDMKGLDLPDLLSIVVQAKGNLFDD